MKINLSLFATLLFSAIATAQTGYWDKERATTREVIVKAGDRISVKTENFPLGTTELVYRITVLDENQQMANSLVSLLKSVPDPSGISQGSAGAVFLLSKISGDDKCRYGIFTSKEKADAFSKTGKPENACLFQPAVVSKDARVLSGRSVCLTVPNLWFAFESDNWVMKQKIVLEVVPWVDKKASTGWSNENKTAVIDLCKTSGLSDLMINSNDLCICILDKFTSKYTFKEYEALMVAEKSKAFRDFGNDCVGGKNPDASLMASIRADAQQHFLAKRYEKSISLLNTTLVANGSATAKDYYSLGKSYLFSRQFSKALQSFKKGEALDGSDLLLKLGLAHSYLLSGDYSAAKELHKRHKNENVSVSQDWKSAAREDMDSLTAAGISSEDFSRILKIIDSK